MKRYLWLFILLGSPSWTFAQSHALYATDGQSLSIMDPTTGTTSNIGNLPPEMGNYSHLELHYDWHNHFLYAIAYDNRTANTAFYAIDKDTAQTHGPFHVDGVVSSSGDPVRALFTGAFCYWSDTFYMVGFNAPGGLSLVRIDPRGWQELGAVDYAGPGLGLNCATFDDWNGTILVAGYASVTPHHLPPYFAVLKATPVNLGVPVTQDGFEGYNGDPVLSMTVDPDSSNLLVITKSGLLMVERGTGNVIRHYEAAGKTPVSIAFGELSLTLTHVTLNTPPSIIHGDQAQFDVVSVTASDGSTPAGTVQVTFSSFGTFTHTLVDGSAKYSLSSLPAGTYQVQASYPVQGNYLASKSAIQTLKVTAPASQVATTTTLSLPSSIVQGDQSQVASVSVTGANASVPSGSVQLTFNGFGSFAHNLPANGATNYTLYSLPVGNYTVQASYPSQGSFAASQSVVQTLTVTSN